MYQELHKGDRVVFREWDDMAAEFGFSSIGNYIHTSASFISSMRPLCGQHGTVTRFNKDTDEVHLSLDDIAAHQLAVQFCITSDMLTLESQLPELTEVNCEDSDSFLSFVLGGDDGI